MRRDLFRPTVEGEARLLLLIHEFSRHGRSLEGRTKLAKLDFFLRYPLYLKRALEIRAPGTQLSVDTAEVENFETRMVRYRYGPWDPAYYSLLGRLIGKGLVAATHGTRGIWFKTTDAGKEVAQDIGSTEEWEAIRQRTELLGNHLNLSGSNLKRFIYRHFPEVTEAAWGEKL
ncbi:hypothetical protein ACFLX5_03910 [Chloroflexota bacterium]